MHSVLRTDVVLLKPTESQELELHKLAKQSSLLWNVANYERRQAYFKHQRIPTYAEQCKTLKHSEHFKAIGTGKGQALMKKLQEAWDSFFALKRLQARGKLPPHIRKVHMPGYWKDRITKQTKIKMFYVRNDCYGIEGSTIVLSKTLKVEYAADRVRAGKRGRLDVIYDRLSNRWYAYIPVEFTPEKVHHPTIKRYGSIDLGICNLVTFYTENERPIIYSGRAVLSDWIYHTKKIAQLQSKLPCKQCTSRRIQRLFRTRQKRFKHAINAMLRDLFKRMQKLGITHLIVGDLAGIRQDNDLGAMNNQKLHNFWSHAATVKRIKELAEEYGIEVLEQNERGTSKTCCMCGNQHNGRIHRGLHLCKENKIVINADVSGAYNILKVAVNGILCSEHNKTTECSSSRVMANPLMLRWEYHQWH